MAGLVLPIAEYSRSEWVSVTGGYVSCGRAAPSLHGAYLFGDFGSSTIWSVRESALGRRQHAIIAEAPEPISSFGEDEAGEVYVVGYGGGDPSHRRGGAGQA